MAQDFLLTYAPLANDIAQRTGLDPSVVLGIVDTETGGGARVSGNNIFGISPVDKSGRQYVEKYPDVETASEAFVTLMQTPRYKAVAAAGGPAQQALALVKSGYNTVNPRYAEIVANKATRFGQILGYQDEGQGGAQPAAAGRPAPDYNNPPPATAPTPAPAPVRPVAPAGSAKDSVLADPLLNPGGAPAKPGTSAKDQVLADPALQTPAPTTTAAPPAAAPGPPREYTTGDAMGDQGGSGGSSMPAPPPLEPSQRGVRVVDAMRKGWEDTPSFWVNQKGESTRSAIENMDPYGFGRFIVAPGGDIIAGAMGAGNALLHGLQETAYQQIAPFSPSLGRDVAALPEAFPFGPPGVTGPHTMQQARTKLGRPVTLGEITDAIKRVDETNTLAPQPGPAPAPEPNALAPAAPAQTTGLENLGGAAQAIGGNLRDMLWDKLQRGDTTELGKPSQILIDAKTAMDQGAIKSRADFDAWTQQWGAQQRTARETPPEQPAPASAGAAATTEPIPEQTKRERVTYLDKDRAQTAWDRAQGMRDDNVYFEGIPPRPEAFRNYDPQYALDHKTYYGDGSNTQYRKSFDAINKERHDGMTDAIRRDMGDGISLDEAKEYRKEASPDALGVFDGEKPVDPGLLDGFRKSVESKLAALEKRGGPRRILEEVHRTLFDKDGNIETLPSRLQGVRDNMTDHLEKGSGTDTAAKDVRAIRHVLTDLVEELNPVMQSGTPKWDTFRTEWAARSRLIDQQNFLQRYRPGTNKSLWDSEGNLVFRKVDQLVADIADAHRKPRHEAQSLTDEQIQTIVNARNELATEHTVDMQAKTKGISPTTQLLNSAAKKGMGPVGKTFQKLGDVVGHAGALYADKPLINAGITAWQVTRPMREARKAAKVDAEINALNEARKAELLSQENRLAP